MSSPMPPELPPQSWQPPAKKSNALMWILIGVAGVIFVGVLLVSAGSYFLYRTVKNAGFDPALMSKNPGLALTKMAAALHPDLEVVSTNDRAGTVTMREKSTGKVMTMKFDPDKKTMVMTGEDGKDVTISTTGDGQSSGGIDVKSSDGTVHIGASAAGQTPSWVPVYPGSAPEGAYSAQTPQGSQNAFGFKTKDRASKVVLYYQDQLRSAGFTVNVVGVTDQGGMLQAEDESKAHSLVITIASSSEGAQVSVMAMEKK